MANSKIPINPAMLNYKIDTSGSSVQLTNYSSSSPYTATEDGIAVVQIKSSGVGQLFMDGLEVINYGYSSSDRYARSAVSVKKGQQLYGVITGGAGYIFFRKYKAV